MEVTSVDCAVVTGAAPGIGAAIARRLATDGHAIAASDRHAEDCTATVNSITAKGGLAIAIAADVADEGAVIDAVSRAASEIGSPQVPVNNAGFALPAPLAEMTTEQWDAVMGVDLRGPFSAARAVSPTWWRRAGDES